MMRKKMHLKLALTSLTMLLAIPVSTAFATSSYITPNEHFEVRNYAGNQVPALVDGSLAESSFHSPTSIEQLSNGHYIISDTLNHTIRLVEQQKVDSFAGLPIGYDNYSFAIGAYSDGVALEAAFNMPLGLAVDSQDNIYVADSGNHVIRKITKDGEVTTVAGTTVLGHRDGKANSAQFNLPSDVAIDSQGNLYVADTLNHAIRKINPSGEVITLNALSTRVVEYTPGYADFSGDFADGALAIAKFNEPTHIEVDSKDNLYVTDSGNQRIRYIDLQSNTVTTVAGSGLLAANELYVEPGYKDGKADEARFNSPEGIALVNDTTLLVADRNNHVIRVIEDGVVKTIAGIGEQYGGTNGVLSAATFNQPYDVFVTGDGALLVADSGYNRLKIVASYLHFAEATDINHLQIVVNGKVLQANDQPFIVSGRTVLPLRSIGEALGLEVSYDPQTKQIKLAAQNAEYIFNVDSNQAAIVENGEVTHVELDVSVQLKNGVSFIPVRFISEQLGYDVIWDKDMQNVVIRNLTIN